MSHFDFTPSIREALFAARDSALELRHEYVGTEHLLLGLVRIERSSAAAALGTLGISADEVRKTVLGHVRVGQADSEPDADLPYTSRSQKVIELAMIAARERGDPLIDPTHLLLGLAREERGIGAQVLTQLGAGPAELLAAIDRVVRRNGPPDTAEHVGIAPRTILLGKQSGEPAATHVTVARRRPASLGIVIAVALAAVVLWILLR